MNFFLWIHYVVAIEVDDFHARFSAYKLMITKIWYPSPLLIRLSATISNRTHPDAARSKLLLSSLERPCSRTPSKYIAAGIVIWLFSGASKDEVR